MSYSTTTKFIAHQLKAITVISPNIHIYMGLFGVVANNCVIKTPKPHQLCVVIFYILGNIGLFSPCTLYKLEPKRSGEC